MFICEWKPKYSHSSLCTWHNNNVTIIFSNHTDFKSTTLSELPALSNKLWIMNGKWGLMHMESVFLLNSGFLHKHMWVLHQSTNLVKPWHQQCCVRVFSSQMHSSQDKGLSSINRALAIAMIDPHILWALTFFYELHTMEKDKKEGRHAACAAQRSLPTVISGAPCGAMWWRGALTLIWVQLATIILFF